MKLWMKVSNDRFELPEIITDSAVELAKICGVSVNTVYGCAWRQQIGKLKRSEYVCVNVEDEEAEKEARRKHRRIERDG